MMERRVWFREDLRETPRTFALDDEEDLDEEWEEDDEWEDEDEDEDDWDDDDEEDEDWEDWEEDDDDLGNRTQSRPLWNGVPA